MAKIKTKKNKLVILVILSVLTVVVLSQRFFYRSITEGMYEQITQGMQNEDVKALLGLPFKTKEYQCSAHGSFEVWNYNIRYSLLCVSIWFKPREEDEKLCVFGKTWGFERLKNPICSIVN